MRAVSLFLLVGSLLLAGALPAAAADPENRIGLSRDGVTWDGTLAPLFDADFRWVPGDVETRTFFVRNQSAHAAELSVEMLGSRVDSLLATGDLTISARADGMTGTDVSSPGRYRLVTWVPEDAQQVRRVDVRVAFDPTSPNVSQTRSLDLDLQVLLRQADPSHPEGPGTAGSAEPSAGAGDGLLPNTGAPAFWSVFAGMALVVSGLIVALRRRQEEESHVQ